MSASHARLRSALFCLLIAASPLTSTDAFAQTDRLSPPGAGGGQLSQGPAANAQGDRQEAISALLQLVENEGKKDPQAWFRLGVEYNRAGDVERARAAFRQAVKLRPGFAAAHAGVAYTFFVEKNFAEAEREALRAGFVDRNSKDFTALNVLAAIRTQRYREAAIMALARAEVALANNPDAAEWYLVKAQALVGLSIPEQKIPPDLSFRNQANTPPPDEAARKAARAEARKRDREAADSLEKYLSLARPVANGPYLREQLEALRYYSQDADDSGAADKAYGTTEVTTKAVIRRKPEPGFTEDARKAGLNGTIRLRAVLAADGTVKRVLVIMPLGYGLSEVAVKAARAIKFTPATINGAPVSQYILLEYNFSTY
jgi:TonB family protein